MKGWSKNVRDSLVDGSQPAQTAEANDFIRETLIASLPHYNRNNAATWLSRALNRKLLPVTANK